MPGNAPKKAKMDDEPLMMTDRHQAIIKVKLVALANSLAADNILNHLVASDVISVDEMADIRAEKTQKRKADALLALLLMKEDKMFYVLIEACQKNAMKHIAKLLRDEDEKRAKEEEAAKKEQEQEEEEENEEREKDGRGSASASDNDEEPDLMSKEHKALLEKHRTNLVQNMLPDEVVNHLRSKGALEPREDDEISQERGVDAKNSALLNKIRRKDDSAFRKLVGGLKETGQGHLARLLDGGAKRKLK